MDTSAIASIFEKVLPETRVTLYKEVKQLVALNSEEFKFISSFIYNNNEIKFLRSTLDLENLDGNSGFIVNTQRVNDIKYVNRFFSEVNNKLLPGGFFIGCVEIHSQRRRRIKDKYPFIIAELFILLSFIFNRVLPRIKPTRHLHKYLTKGNNRVMSKAEILGRLVYSGFDIIDYKHINNLVYFAVKKVQEPFVDKRPTFGLIIKMSRMGKGGKFINVYKFRTMHPYSEYLQEYVFKNNNIDSGGKFKNDFRVARWGKYLRMLWLDELPMIFNFIKGDIKLVGVRPISFHYFNLYPSCFKERRIKYKPGLFPPFYADLPKTIDDIIASEKKYLDLYDKHPVKTDIKYFFQCWFNILVKHARSA